MAVVEDLQEVVREPAMVMVQDLQEVVREAAMAVVEDLQEVIREAAMAMAQDLQGVIMGAIVVKMVTHFPCTLIRKVLRKKELVITKASILPR